MSKFSKGALILKHKIAEEIFEEFDIEYSELFQDFNEVIQNYINELAQLNPGIPESDLRDH